MNEAEADQARGSSGGGVTTRDLPDGRREMRVNWREVEADPRGWAAGEGYPPGG